MLRTEDGDGKSPGDRNRVADVEFEPRSHMVLVSIFFSVQTLYGLVDIITQRSSLVAAGVAATLR